MFCRWQVRSHGSNSLFILLFHHHHHGDNRTGMVLSTSRGLLSKGHTTVFSPPTRYVNRWLESTSLTRRPLSSPVADLEPKSWIADLENDLRDKKSKKKRVRVDAGSRVHDSLAVQWHSKVGNRMRHAHTPKEKQRDSHYSLQPPSRFRRLSCTTIKRFASPASRKQPQQESLFFWKIFCLRVFPPVKRATMTKRPKLSTKNLG